MRGLLSGLLFCLACCAMADTVLLDPCTSGWGFSNGGEFPGAKGALAFDPAVGRLRLDYDFTGGGAYVAASYAGVVPEAAEALTLTVESEQDCALTCRLVDATNRTFQTGPISVTGGKLAELVLRADSPWTGAWGGTEASKPQAPWQGCWLLVERNGAATPTGSLRLLGLTASGAGVTASPFAGKDFSAALGDSYLAGRWVPCAQGATLLLTCRPEQGESLELAFAPVCNGRPAVQRFTVSEPVELAVHFPLKNPRTRYSIDFTASDGSEQLTRELAVATPEAVWDGRTLVSSEIRTARFGSATHFSFGPDYGWSQWRRLIDLAAECGMKYLRDEVRFVTGADGKPRIRPYDLEWMKYAREKGIHLIIVLGCSASDSVEEYVERCTVAARELSGIVDVLELGNEPNNFGDWIGTYGGTWNGKEADNSTSRWVYEFLKYTNAAAEAVKAVDSGMTVIGTGACSPTNVRMLDIGLSPAVDGIVDHPYSYSMPAEHVPWSVQLKERDGIVIGDEQGSFTGLIQGYVRHCERTGRPRTLWLTEYGFATFRCSGKNEEMLYAGFSEAAQAAYLLRRNLLALGLPVIRASTQYDLQDDGTDPYNPEANFGIIRNDFSLKPAYRALQRFNTLLADCVPAKVAARVTAAPLHGSMRRGPLIRDWDGAHFDVDNSVLIQAVENPFTGARFLAAWSAQPYGGEFNNRSAAIEIDGWTDAALPLTALDLMTGQEFDVEAHCEDGKLRIDSLELGQHPVLLFF